MEVGAVILKVLVSAATWVMARMWGKDIRKRLDQKNNKK